MVKLVAWWYRLKEGLWFIPGLFTIAAVLAAVAAVRLDEGRLGDLELPRWIFAGGVEGARGVLSAVATSIITVTGVVFSVTIVALQLASTQFTPRVLRNFTSDRANQVVLGVFIGTFTYSLLVLRAVRSPAEEAEAFVPGVSVALAILLALVSIGHLIFFIDHLAGSIQVESILDRVAGETEDVIERVYGEPWEDAAGSYPAPEGEPGVVAAAKSGYLQELDASALVEAAEERGLLLRVEHAMGTFLLSGEPLVTVWPADALRQDLAHEIRGTIVQGHERTPRLDIGRGLLELVDIAVKALSPSINDPTTASACVDRLCQVVLTLADHAGGEGLRRGPAGDARLLLPRITFDEAVETSFGTIRRYAADHPAVVRHLLDRLARTARQLPPERRGVVADQVSAILQSAREAGNAPADMERIEQAGRHALTLARKAAEAEGAD